MINTLNVNTTELYLCVKITTILLLNFAQIILILLYFIYFLMLNDFTNAIEEYSPSTTELEIGHKHYKGFVSLKAVY